MKNKALFVVVVALVVLTALPAQAGFLRDLFCGSDPKAELTGPPGLTLKTVARDYLTGKPLRFVVNVNGFEKVVEFQEWIPLAKCETGPILTTHAKLVMSNKMIGEIYATDTADAIRYAVPPPTDVQNGEEWLRESITTVRAAWSKTHGGVSLPPYVFPSFVTVPCDGTGFYVDGAGNVVFSSNPKDNTAPCLTPDGRILIRKPISSYQLVIVSSALQPLEGPRYHTLKVGQAGKNGLWAEQSSCFQIESFKPIGSMTQPKVIMGNQPPGTSPTPIMPPAASTPQIQPIARLDNPTRVPFEFGDSSTGQQLRELAQSMGVTDHTLPQVSNRCSETSYDHSLVMIFVTEDGRLVTRHFAPHLLVTTSAGTWRWRIKPPSKATDMSDAARYWVVQDNTFAALAVGTTFTVMAVSNGQDVTLATGTVPQGHVWFPIRIASSVLAGSK